MPDVQAAAGGVSFDAPEGTVTVNGDNHHIAKTALIGKIGPDGLIYTDWSSPGPIEPDPFLKTYPWGSGLAADPQRRLPDRPGRAVPTRGGRRAESARGRSHVGERSRMEVLVTQVFNGLSVGSILLLAALGLALTFGQMGVINMAHGEFIMAGAYTAYVMQTRSSAARACRCSCRCRSRSWSAARSGVLLEVTLLRRMYHRPLDTLLVTWGVALVLQQLARDIFGTAGVDVPAPGWLSGPVEVLGLAFPTSRLFILALSIAAFGGAGRGPADHLAGPADPRDRAEPAARRELRDLHPGHRPADVLPRLRPGRRRRRRADPDGSISPNLGTGYIIDAFLVVVVGGIGQIKGAVIAAFALGVVSVLSSTRRRRRSPR